MEKPALLSTDLLTIYLNDHLAGATAGVELARRAAGENKGSELDPDCKISPPRSSRTGKS